MAPAYLGSWCTRRPSFQGILAAIALAWLLAAMGGSALWAVDAGLNRGAWHSVLNQAAVWSALRISLISGLGATVVAIAATAWLLAHSFAQPLWNSLVRQIGLMLALPHAAFAIGLFFLIAPSGWLLRTLSPWATAYTAPPAWITTQDPWGLGLAAVLVAKELPFLLWAATTQLRRTEVQQLWTRQWLVARSMGYAPATAWWRVVWPQLWPRLQWPALAVLAYNLTVVDVALIIGPTSPPSLAVMAWQWLQDADLARQAQGAAAGGLLAGVVTLVGGLGWLAAHAPWWRARGSCGHGRWDPDHGQRAAQRCRLVASAAWLALIALYIGVMLVLGMSSIAGLWAFPALWPQSLTLAGWRAVAASASTLGTTLGLGLASASAALVWAVTWLECVPAHWDARLQALINLPLLLPPVLWVVGMHGLALRWGIDATGYGVWMSHTLAAMPYVLLALRPAYMGFDQRLRWVAASLGQGHARFLIRVKWPLLRAALSASLAVGFAVSVAQYLPTLYLGAGRLETVTTEAVNLAAGGQRTLTAAYAWLQWLLPALGFGLATWAGRPRRWPAAACSPAALLPTVQQNHVLRGDTHGGASTSQTP